MLFSYYFIIWISGLTDTIDGLFTFITLGRWSPKISIKLYYYWLKHHGENK